MRHNTRIGLPKACAAVKVNAKLVREAMSDYFKQLTSIVKSRRREILLFFLLFLISSISFGLGYLTAKELNPAPIIIEKNSGN